MGQLVFITGPSGVGKSRSIKTMNPENTLWIKVQNKLAPFPEKKMGWSLIGDDGSGNQVVSNDYEFIKMLVLKAKSKGFKSIVIDDGSYLMSNELMATMEETGYEKFVRMANNVWELCKTITEETDDDVITYLTWHTEQNQDGSLKLKTVGKLVEEKLTIEGLATIVLRADRLDSAYKFRTQHANDISKSPEGLFETEIIDNDLGLVDKSIREYWGL